MEKPPYEIDCHKKFMGHEAYYIFADDNPVEDGEVPKGLEALVSFAHFVRTFFQGAERVVIEQHDRSDLVYRLQSDQVRGEYRLFLYRRV